MDAGHFAQALKVTFIRINETSITINVRTFDKDLPALPEHIAEIKGLNFVEGQTVQLLYTDKNTWQLKEINLDKQDELKYFRKDEL